MIRCIGIHIIPTAGLVLQPHVKKVGQALGITRPNYVLPSHHNVPKYNVGLPGHENGYVDSIIHSSHFSLYMVINCYIPYTNMPV